MRAVELGLSCALLLAGELKAGKAIDTALASISELDVRAVVLDTMGEPKLLGDTRALQVSLQSSVAQRLAADGIKIVPDHAMWLYVFVDVETTVEVADFCALQVEVELNEPMRPERHIDWYSAFSPYGVSWKSDVTRVVRKTELAEEIRNWVENLADEFVGDRRMAISVVESRRATSPGPN